MAFLNFAEKDVNVGGTGSMVTSAASWAGWAVSGVASVTSKIYKGKRPSSAEKGKSFSPNQLLLLYKFTVRINVGF